MSRVSPGRALFLLTVTLTLPGIAAAQTSIQPASFPERRSLELTPQRFTDRDVTELLSTLDALVAAGEPSPALTYWNFVRSLQAGVLTPVQEARVVAHLSNLARTRPDHAKYVETAGTMLTRLTVGKVAPDIIGRDLDGTEFKLSDYRGRVVLLVFGSEWCAICRTQFPYERLLLDLYRNWPFTLLGVDTGSSREAVKQARGSAGLPYRAWWDGTNGDHSIGPIASQWNALGFPTAYLIDAEGVIRFVDLRNEDLLKGVRQLLEEQIEIQVRK